MNHCTFEGRLSVAAEERTLPSGDVVVNFRLIVPRDEPGRVDTIDCVARPAALRRRLLRLEAGCALHVEGALHRRFWRSTNGPASRYEVDVAVLRRLT